jgi:hypothetical protein
MVPLALNMKLTTGRPLRYFNSVPLPAWLSDNESSPLLFRFRLPILKKTSEPSSHRETNMPIDIPVNNPLAQ